MKKGLTRPVVTHPMVSRVDQIKILRRLEAFSKAKEEIEELMPLITLHEGWEKAVSINLPPNERKTEIAFPAIRNAKILKVSKVRGR